MACQVTLASTSHNNRRNQESERCCAQIEAGAALNMTASDETMIPLNMMLSQVVMTFEGQKVLSGNSEWSECTGDTCVGQVMVD